MPNYTVACVYLNSSWPAVSKTENRET